MSIFSGFPDKLIWLPRPVSSLYHGNNITGRQATTCNSTTVTVKGYMVVCDVPNQVNAKRRREDKEDDMNSYCNIYNLEIPTTLKEFC